jgi:DNA (cytosine-5)-methyltransferase 1
MDVRDLDAKTILAKTGLAAGELDVLLGGPPCQGFSSAGMKADNDPRNSLFRHYIRLLEGIHPKWFIMENVEGLLTNGGGRHVRDAVASFLNLGYVVNIEKIYAQGYGIPQRRKRVLIVGNRIGYDFSFPKIVTQFFGNIFRKGELTFSSATNDLPKPATSENQTLPYALPPQNELQTYFRVGSEDVSSHFSPPLSKIQNARVSYLKQGQTMKDLPGYLQHESFSRRAFRRVLDGIPPERRGGAPTGLKRLFDDEPCLTITSAATREFVHPQEDRLLTLRECARLQTFPDSFAFVGSTNSRIRQIGNAIPPLLAQTIAKHIIENYGFHAPEDKKTFPKLRLCLTRADGMSPALSATEKLLFTLIEEKETQLTFF